MFKVPSIFLENLKFSRNITLEDTVSNQNPRNVFSAQEKSLKTFSSSRHFLQNFQVEKMPLGYYEFLPRARHHYVQ